MVKTTREIRKLFDKYGDVPQVRGTLDEFTFLSNKGWRINADFLWTRRWRQTDPRHFVLDTSVGVNSESGEVYAPSCWYFRTAGGAARFEQGILRGLGNFNCEYLTAWKDGPVRVWYAVVGGRIMGEMRRGLGDERHHVFNVVLIGEKGSRRFKIKPHGHEITVPIDVQQAPETATDTATKPDSREGDCEFLRGFIQGYREGAEFVMQRIDEKATLAAKGVDPVAPTGEAASLPAASEGKVVTQLVDQHQSKKARKKPPKGRMVKSEPRKPRESRGKKRNGTR